ncbi:TPM domain-containing protein [Novosphingobium sp. 9]|uniref:TPM domain-containing protein n=1 Tax=Novosphingobium sp. 9 TaxID=2025349 RepID=UPI0021B69B14|nr:hypothetical protein [Novosphingobium sp. 9]
MTKTTSAPSRLTDADRQRVADAVAAAELKSSGEIVTILAERSDGYTDVALSWAAGVAFLALWGLALAPDFYLRLYDRLFADWGHEWTPHSVLMVALFVCGFKFAGMMLIQMWAPLRYWLIPGAVKSARVRDRALRAFRIAADQRTAGKTGVLIYLSMREHRAEIVADRAIAAKVAPEVWGSAMSALLSHVREGRVAEGMAVAVEQVGDILAPHFPRADDDINELPDRLIEV